MNSIISFILQTINKNNTLIDNMKNNANKCYDALPIFTGCLRNSGLNTTDAIAPIVGK